jgi:hypothetical protein
MSASFEEQHLGYQLVDDERALVAVQALLARRRDAGALERVAVDFEFAGHVKRLRLLQLGLEGSAAFPEQQLLLDAFRVDLRPFGELFADEDVEKLVHAPGGDYQGWLEYNGARDDESAERFAFRNVYDIAQRAGLLQKQLIAQGSPQAQVLLDWCGKGKIVRGPQGYQVSLGELMTAMLGVAPGDRRDHWDDRWRAEPLPEHQLKIAALDVAALPHVQARLVALELEALGSASALASEAALVDRRIFEQARDLALVPRARRDELQALLSQFARQAAQGDGQIVLPVLTPAERRSLLSEFRGPATTRDGRPLLLVEQQDQLLVRSLTRERRAELGILAEQIDRQPQPQLPELEPLDAWILRGYLIRRYPDTATELELISDRSRAEILNRP